MSRSGQPEYLYVEQRDGATCCARADDHKGETYVVVIAATDVAALIEVPLCRRHARVLRGVLDTV